MGNSAVAVKLGADKNSCSRQDIEWRENTTAMWTVDINGNPSDFKDQTEEGDFQCYYCNNCDEEFVDELHKTAWQLVKEHLHASNTTED